MVPAVAIGLLLAYAAWRDLLTRTIPDTVSIAIAVLGLGTRLSAGLVPMLVSLGVATLLFLLLLALAMRGWLGGGDVKLIAAVAAGLPPAATGDFLMATVLVGGILGIAYIAGRRLVPPARVADRGRPLMRIAAVEARRLRRGGPVPYGLAIALGGCALLISGS